MVRIIGGLLAGVLIFLGILSLVEWGAHLVHPRPASTALYAIVVAAYFVSACVGAIVAGLIARRVWAAWAIAILVLLGVIWTLADIPHPMWMRIASVLAPFVAGFVASAVVHKRTRGPDPAAAI
jgi:MFS family permease